MTASVLALRDASVDFARALVESGATPDQQAQAIASTARGHAIAHAGFITAATAAEVATALRRAADAYEKHGVGARH